MISGASISAAAISAARLFFVVIVAAQPVYFECTDVGYWGWR